MFLEGLIYRFKSKLSTSNEPPTLKALISSRNMANVLTLQGSSDEKEENEWIYEATVSRDSKTQFTLMVYSVLLLHKY